MKKCSYCPKQFEPENPRQKYCCVRCRGKAAQKRFRVYRAAGIPVGEKSEAWNRAVIAPRHRAIASSFTQFLGDRDQSVECRLGIHQFGLLISQPCFYCGNPPRTKAKSGKMLRNGIDRLDPKIGYLVVNCVPCCWTCNRMKFNHSAIDFIAHIEAIYKHQYR